MLCHELEMMHSLLHNISVWRLTKVQMSCVIPFLGSLLHCSYYLATIPVKVWAHTIFTELTWIITRRAHFEDIHNVSFLWFCNSHSPSQNTNVYHMVVQCSQMFVNIKPSITVFNKHFFDVCEDSSKCEKRLCLAGSLHHILVQYCLRLKSSLKKI